MVVVEAGILGVESGGVLGSRDVSNLGAIAKYHCVNSCGMKCVVVSAYRWLTLTIVCRGVMKATVAASRVVGPASGQ